MNFNPIRCDQCTKRRYQCDRTLPFCKICTNRKEKCTYLTQSKYTKRLGPVKDQIFKFKKQQPVKIKAKTKKKKSKDLRWMIVDPGLKKDQLQIAKLPHNFNWDHTPLGITNRIPRKLALENLMTLLQYPSLYKLSQGLDLFLTLCEKLRLLYSLPSILYPASITQRPKNLPLNKLLEEAIQNYFIYVNPVVPLFIEEEFDFFSKPLLLRLAIMGSGILWSKDSEAKSYLVNYFNDKITERLRYIHRLKPSLELIQAFLIIIGAFRHITITMKLSFDLTSYCNRFSVALGLNLPSNSIKGTWSVERALAYSYSNFINQYNNITTGLNTYPPASIELLTKIYISMHSEIVKSTNLTKNLNIISKIIIGSAHNDLSLIFFSLRMLKNSFLFSKQPFEELEIISNSILKKIQQVEMRYSREFDLLNNHLENIKLNELQSYILSLCQYCKYFLYTLHLYHPRFTISKDQFQPDQKFLSIVNKAFKACHSIIKLSYTLPAEYFISVGVSNLSQCITFMMRYNKYLQQNPDSTIKLGKQKIKDLNRILLTKLITNINLYFIELVEENV